MDGQVTLGGCRVVAHLTSVGLVAAGVGLAAGQPRVLLASDAVDAGGLTVRVLLLHVDLQCFLVFVVPVAFGTLEGLAGVVAGIPSLLDRAEPVRVQDEITLGTLDAGGPALDVLRAGADRCALE